MERNSNVKPTNEETNNLISLCEAIRDNKPKQFKKCLKKTSHRPEFLLKQSVTIKAQKLARFKTIK